MPHLIERSEHGCGIAVPSEPHAALVKDKFAAMDTKDQRRHASPINPAQAISELRALHSLPYRDRRARICELLQTRYPRFLYRYTRLKSDDALSVERLREIVVYSELWLSSPPDFNDPFDMSAVLLFEGTPAQRRSFIAAQLRRWHPDVLSKQRARRIEETMAHQDVMEATLREKFHESIAKIGVTCLTPDPKSVLMWSHYGAEHTGVALQFEPTRDVLNLASAIPVNYADQYPVVKWFDGTNHGIKRVLLQKHPAWRYEREFRIIRPGDAKTRLIIAPDALTGIILGCRASTETEAAIWRLLGERAGFGKPSIALYRAERHPSEYRLVLRRLASPARSF